ncbi:hypothetical protein C1674_06790 [Klebsiella pneumoniae]|nr:hypothetical protein C1674_06790 [Klebsiella pneumoniae]
MQLIDCLINKNFIHDILQGTLCYKFGGLCAMKTAINQHSCDKGRGKKQVFLARRDIESGKLAQSMNESGQ